MLCYKSISKFLILLYVKFIFIFNLHLHSAYNITMRTFFEILIILFIAKGRIYFFIYSLFIYKS